MPKADAPLPSEGTVCEGRVVGVQAYGAFIELDGVSTHALVHISQLAPRRVETVAEVVSSGDRVRVLILPAERPGRLSASLKAVDQATGALIDSGGGGGSGGGGMAMDRRRRGEDEDVSGMTWGLQPLDRGGEAEGAEGEAAEPAKPKAQPNYATTGVLADESNKVNGVVLKWSEPISLFVHLIP